MHSIITWFVFHPLQMSFSSQYQQQRDKEGAALRRIHISTVPWNLFIVLNFSGFQQLLKNVLESAQCQPTASVEVFNSAVLAQQIPYHILLSHRLTICSG